jgi:hypothetical protein
VIIKNFLSKPPKRDHGYGYSGKKNSFFETIFFDLFPFLQELQTIYFTLLAKKSLPILNPIFYSQHPPTEVDEKLFILTEELLILTWSAVNYHTFVTNSKPQTSAFSSMSIDIVIEVNDYAAHGASLCDQFMSLYVNYTQLINPGRELGKLITVDEKESVFGYTKPKLNVFRTISQFLFKNDPKLFFGSVTTNESPKIKEDMDSYNKNAKFINTIPQIDEQVYNDNISQQIDDLLFQNIISTNDSRGDKFQIDFFSQEDEYKSNKSSNNDHNDNTDPLSPFQQFQTSIFDNTAKINIIGQIWE